MTSRPSSASDVVPKPNLGQFVFTDKLGSGTYATVYKAYRRTGVREVVAIKCVLKSSLNKASTENLLTEIELLKNLKHEHIVALKDFQWDANYIYLIMEYCSGGDLSRFIRSKRALPEHIVKRFLQQIAAAMKFLWDNNVAHMDLKPQNILLTSSTSPQIKLADFGFAKHLYDGDRLFVMRGSPLYMAPEIICRASYDNRVDLWSIGVILFECLFGKAPFASSSFRELGSKIWDVKPVEMPQGFDISDNARDLILRLLQRNPRDRITFDEFFAHPFVDIEHIPSKTCLPTAVKLIEKAVVKDEAGDYRAAVRFYCEALDFFMPAIHYEKSSQKKESLRSKVKQYMKRAETLKQLMKTQLKSSPNSKSSNFASDNNASSSPSSTSAATSSPKRDIPDLNVISHDSKTPPKVCAITDNNNSPEGMVAEFQFSDTKPNSSNDENASATPKTGVPFLRSMSSQTLEKLLDLCSDSPQLMAALKLINAAIMEEQQEDYDQSLHHYELALGAILKLLPSEPKGKRRDLLNSQAAKWMDKAERLKAYLEIRNLNTQDTSIEEEESEKDFLSDSKQCSIQ